MSDNQISFVLPDKHKKLNQESGGHRIQRVPPTEKRGRVHTSTVTVAVIDKAEADPRYALRDTEHFYKEWFSGTGNGGQNRNKHQNCLRLYHLPTGIVQTIQGKSRTSNETTAMKELCEKLDQLSHSDSMDGTNQDRREKIGSGMRADKIRTYRFQDDQVNDHQSNKSTSCKRIMRGMFDELWR